VTTATAISTLIARKRAETTPMTLGTVPDACAMTVPPQHLNGLPDVPALASMLMLNVLGNDELTTFTPLPKQQLPLLKCTTRIVPWYFFPAPR